MLRRFALLVSVLVLLATVLCGCGGGGGGGPTLAVPSVSVDWPLRTRNLVGPSSALSVKIVLSSTVAGQPSVEIDGNRASNLASHTETYAASGKADTGAYTLTATFYSGASLQGIVVATASASVAVSTAGPLVNANGTTLSQISFTGTVATVTVPTVVIPQIETPVQLGATVEDSQGNILALSPGSFTFKVVTGSNVLSVTPDGIATGVASGQATITATVDGITSPEGTISVSPQTPSVAVDWPLRTRNLLGPSSALSVSIVLTNSQASGENATINANRSTTLAAHTETYAATSTVFSGTYTLTASFYSQANQQGVVVGTASANVAVSSTGVVTNSDGTSLSPIAFTGVVSSVSIAAAQILQSGTPTQLVVSAKNAQNNVLALSPGSFSFTLVSGSSYMSLTPDGIATAIASGQAMVTATVDGVTSPQAAISVSPQTPSIAVDWPLRTRNLLGPSSALSVSIVLTSSQSSSENVTINGNRSTTLAAHTETYSPSSQIFAGTYTLTANFYSQPNQLAIIVGTASANVAVSSTGVVTNTDGSPLSPISFTGVVTSVVISPGQTALIGIADQLVAGAKNAQGNTLALTPGSFDFAVTSGGSFVTVTPDGIATGVSAGSASVTATVDGVTSAAATVAVAQSVDFTNPGFESPQIPTNTWLADQDAITGGLVGWTGTRTAQGSWGFENGASSWGAAAHSGTQFAFIQYGGALMQQTVTGLIAGQQYQVQFWSCGRDGDVGGNAPCPLTVTENGNVIFPATSPAGPGQWTQYTSNTFTSDGTPCLFLFQTSESQQDASDLLDDVHLIPVSSAAVHKR